MEGSLCKHCGAILPMADMEGRISCLSCGRSSKARSEPPPSSTTSRPGAGTSDSTDNPFTSWTPDPEDLQQTTKAVTRAASGGMIGCLVIVALTVAGIGAAIFFTTKSVTEAVDRASSPGGGSRSSLSVAGSNVVVVGDDASEIIGAAYDGSADTRFLARLSLGGDEAGAADGGEVWRSDEFPTGVYGGPVAILGETVFVALGDSLWAIDGSTGETKWKATLPDVVHTSCDCFLVNGDTLIVQTADAQVFAFGADSSEPRWGHRLVSPSGKVVPSGAGLAVVDDSPDSPGDRQVAVLDLNTGGAVSTTVPTCTDSGGSTREMMFTDSVFAVPGGPDLVATLAFGGGCAVRWNGSTGQVVWTAPTGDVSSSGRETGQAMGDRLVLPTSAGLTSIDLATGTSTQMPAPPDLTVTPRYRTGDVVVAQSATSRGTTRYGLIGFDVASGQVRWQQSLPGGGQLVDVGGSSSNALFSGTQLSALVRVGEGLSLLTFDTHGETTTVTIAALDPSSGELSEGIDVDVDSGPGTPSVGVIDVTATGVLVNVDQEIIHIALDGTRSTYP